MPKPLYWHPSRVGICAVGGHYYRPTLEALAGDPHDGRGSVFFTATLLPEDHNEHDRNAVAVMLGGDKLAHLSREDASRYRKAVGAQPTRADAVLSRYGSLDFRLDLFLDLDQPPDPRSRPRPLYETTRFELDGELRLMLSGDRFTAVVPCVQPEVANNCWPGEQLSVWTKPDLQDVHFFDKGSVGGTGRIAVIPKAVLSKLGSPVDQLQARVVIAGGTGIVFEILEQVAPRGPGR